MAGEMAARDVAAEDEKRIAAALTEVREEYGVDERPRRADLANLPAAQEWLVARVEEGQAEAAEQALSRAVAGSRLEALRDEIEVSVGAALRSLDLWPATPEHRFADLRPPAVGSADEKVGAYLAHLLGILFGGALLSLGARSGSTC